MNTIKNMAKDMTLRDWFAGQAIIGVMLNDPSSREGWYESFAKDSYRIADAMLAARREWGGSRRFPDRRL